MGAAIRFITSAPVPELHNSGARPSIIVSTVISFGRTRRAAPSTMASSRSAGERRRPASERSRQATRRYKSITTPVCASSPASAISPTQTATERS